MNRLKPTEALEKAAKTLRPYLDRFAVIGIGKEEGLIVTATHGKTEELVSRLVEGHTDCRSLKRVRANNIKIYFSDAQK